MRATQQKILIRTTKQNQSPPTHHCLQLHRKSSQNAETNICYVHMKGVENCSIDQLVWRNTNDHTRMIESLNVRTLDVPKTFYAKLISRGMSRQIILQVRSPMSASTKAVAKASLPTNASNDIISYTRNATNTDVQSQAAMLHSANTVHSVSTFALFTKVKLPTLATKYSRMDLYVRKDSPAFII